MSTRPILTLSITSNYCRNSAILSKVYCIIGIISINYFTKPRYNFSMADQTADVTLYLTTKNHGFT